ncbi:acetyl-CoA carboxylase biotin carboxyl carrier protein subunit [Phreatobacter sp.]|uniref:acetyl-CoA carboxylase biotin carboxyl carrier protein subunit n=1 Tax=Phreatobacter sp. TaxID=1966341 RepID=UPI003F70B5C8
MRHAFAIAGTETEVWLSREAGAYRLHGDAGTARVALQTDGPGAGLTIDGRHEPALVVIDGETIHVHVAGGTFALHHRDPVRRFVDTGAGAGADVARAPMPGTVVRIDVAIGQPVATGDALIVIESMKLETTIRAWQDGVVADLHVAPGQSFDRDAVLVTLAAEAA